ncbi:RNA polymerase recycling motor HelD [Thermotalea metallivorans]|uniref:DNA 3'-5' helicase n=1 Tax=Thermotalea metallivorans TaxID=520762 RepID=A0A140L4L1_9FIRM|nr:RNA polymerase recycling motor HelD [Thermotalea metallivorans]KXG75486.1 Helicase IV [Thermotalea metallivorans]
MQAENHPDYIGEKEHLEETIRWIEGEQKFLEGYETILKDRLREIRKTVKTLTDERLIANQQLYQMASRDIEHLKRSRNHPYFGRIDFQEARRDDVEIIYIGKYGLHDRDREIPVVVDWRAPIADIYYSGHSREVAYRAPSGEVKGQMHLKRRYEIEGGELKEIYDDKTSEDKIEDSLKGKGDFLTEALQKRTHGRLKEIVATIQDQQNRIIRSNAIKPLVVQGVAGSGKTTIALHRMAYLIYNNRRNTDANYMVVAPNQLFLNYISDILPDLGVENVCQTTFEDWALQLIGKDIEIAKCADKLNLLMNSEREEAKIVSLASKLKGSLLFKKVIDHRMRQLEKTLLPLENLSVDDMVLLPYDKIQEIFLTSNVHLPLVPRITKLNEYLKTRLKKEMKEIREKIEECYNIKIDRLKDQAKDTETIRKDIIQLYDGRDEKIERIKQILPALVDRYTEKIEKPDTIQFYYDLFRVQGEIEKAFAPKIGFDRLTQICDDIRKQLSKEIFENEDLGPLAYIHLKLFGLEDKNKYTHIVVDEAQDLDELKMSVLRELSINDSFTFVGDLSQGIYSYRGIHNWTKTMERVFQGREYHYHFLTTSYRSTIEIVNLANGVIQKCKGLDAILAEPIFRHGEKPWLKKCENHEEMLTQMVCRIRHLTKEAYGSIAVICKDLDTTEKVYKDLKGRVENIHLITEQATDFHGGVVVIPSYLSKGLEFDGVLVYGVDQGTYSMEEIDVKLLYIAITRALHRVSMYYQGDLSEVLKGLDDLYDEPNKRLKTK